METQRHLALSPDGLDRKPSRGIPIREIHLHAQLIRQLALLPELLHAGKKPLVLELPLGGRIRGGAVGREIPALDDAQDELAVPQGQAAIKPGAEARVDRRAEEVVFQEPVYVCRRARAQDAVGLEEEDLGVRRQVRPQKGRRQEPRDGGVRVEGCRARQVADLDLGCHYGSREGR